jgi:hypothetical protein
MPLGMYSIDNPLLLLLTEVESCDPEKDDEEKAEICDTKSKRAANERVFMVAVVEVWIVRVVAVVYGISS